MRVHSAILCMAAQSYASVSKTVVLANASPLRGVSQDLERVAILEVRPGNSSERVTLILDSEGARSELLIPVTLESIEAEAAQHQDDESYYPSPYAETSVVFSIRNSWVGEPDLVFEDTNVLTQKYLLSDEESVTPLESHGTLAIGPASAFANEYKSFVLVPTFLGVGTERRIVKHLVLNPVNPGCDCAGPEYRMFAATAIRVPGIGYTTPDVWAVGGFSKIDIASDNGSVFRGSSSSIVSKQARYRISTISNDDHVPEEIYDALVANISAQGASVSTSETEALVPLTIISNCDQVKNWPKITYSIPLSDGSGQFDIVIDQSDYLQPVSSITTGSEVSSSCILRMLPRRQLYSKPIEEYTIGVNILNKIAVHFDNVNRQVGFCYSAEIQREM